MKLKKSDIEQLNAYVSSLSSSDKPVPMPVRVEQTILTHRNKALQKPKS